MTAATPRPELSPNFWHGWIIGLTVLNILALIWLTLSVYFSRRGSEPRDVVWDETLREETNLILAGCRPSGENATTCAAAPNRGR